MLCLKCGNELPDDSIFCQFCGAEVNQVNYCRHCGAELISDALFCSSCGASAKTEQPNEAPPETQPLSAQEEPPRRRKKWQLPVAISLAVLLVAAAGLILFFLLLGKALRLTPAEAAEQVLYLECYDHLDNAIASASGFLIGDGTQLVTNYHVIEDSYYIRVFDHNSQFITTTDKMSGYDKDKDLAILQLNVPADVPPMELADSDHVEQGDTVYAVGYPLGLNNTLSNGIISSRYQDGGTEILQITAPVSTGSSGGVLLNEDGEVIGVISATYSEGQNINLAVSSNDLAALTETFLPQLSLKYLYTQTHPQINMDDYSVQIKRLWVPTEDYADLLCEEWSLSPTDADTTLTMLAACDGLEGAIFYDEAETITPGMWSEAFDEWCFDPCRKLGDIEAFIDGDGYSICCFVDVTKISS